MRIDAEGAGTGTASSAPGRLRDLGSAGSRSCAALTGLLLLGPTPWQLADAAVLGLVLAQLGSFAYEAAHRQVFDRGPANDIAARIIGPASARRDRSHLPAPAGLPDPAAPAARGGRLHAHSLWALLSTRPDRERLLELVLVVARLAALPVLVFAVLPPGLASLKRLAAS